MRFQYYGAVGFPGMRSARKPTPRPRIKTQQQQTTWKQPAAAAQLPASMQVVGSNLSSQKVEALERLVKSLTAEVAKMKSTQAQALQAQMKTMALANSLTANFKALQKDVATRLAAAIGQIKSLAGQVPSAPIFRSDSQPARPSMENEMEAEIVAEEAYPTSEEGYSEEEYSDESDDDNEYN